MERRQKLYIALPIGMATACVAGVEIVNSFRNFSNELVEAGFVSPFEQKPPHSERIIEVIYSRPSDLRALFDAAEYLLAPHNSYDGMRDQLNGPHNGC